MCKIWIGVRMSYYNGIQQRVVVDENGILNHEKNTKFDFHLFRITHILNESTRQMKLSVVTILHYGYLLSCYLSA